MKKWIWIVMDGAYPQRWSRPTKPSQKPELQWGGYAQGFDTKAEADKAKRDLVHRYCDIANRATGLEDPLFKKWSDRANGVKVVRVWIA